MRETAEQRLARMTRIEGPLWAQNILPGGVDEAGRGPLAGPVVAACVVMRPNPLLEGINDSKRVSSARREALYQAILDTAVSYGIGVMEAEDIDRIGIRPATRQAMAKAIQAAGARHVLVDYEKDLEVQAQQTAIVHGDAQSYSIAAASIVAKVYRDRRMVEYDELYPLYGFARHKGYGTREHIEVLRTIGRCPIHRSLFIRNFLEE